MATDPQAQTRHPGYELSDANPRKVSIFFLSMAVFLILMGLAIAWLFGHYVRTDIPKPFVAQPFENVRPVPPPPLLQPSPTIDIQQYKQSQQNVLNSYGWVDRRQGVVHIPIERAIELLSEKGLPARTNPSAGVPAQSDDKSDSLPSKNASNPAEVQP